MLVLGDKDSAWAQKAVQDARASNADRRGQGLRTATLAIKSSQRLSASGALLVDGSLAAAHPSPREYGSFAGQSLLVVNAAAADGERSVAEDGTSGFPSMAEQLHIMDVKG